MGNGNNWKNWNGLAPGQLKQEIEQAVQAAENGNPPLAAGAYYALVVNVENPITGYQVKLTAVPPGA